MKHSLLALVLLCAVGVASATGKPTTQPEPASTATSQAAAVAVAGALSASQSNAKATGGDAHAAAQGGGATVATEAGNTYVLPAPAVTYVPHSQGGIVTKSHAVNLLLFSWSKSEQATDPFHGGMRLVDEYERLCQFETAAMLRQRQYALLDPAYRELPAQPGVRNLTPAECAAARR